MTSNGMQQLNATALKPYPESGPVDLPLFEHLCRLWKHNRSFIVLSGPPGVGKTRAAEDFIIEMLRMGNAPYGINECRITNLFRDYSQNIIPEDKILSTLQETGVQFVWDILVLHPQYSYEDLIRGVRLSCSDNGTPTIKAREGMLSFISRVAQTIEKHRSCVADIPSAVLILDEINRAAIGQLFGEAIYALDRRGTPVTTPHTLDGNIGSTLTIPSNLLLLGTMNSVDRAISGIDFALKRRFATVTIASKLDVLESRYATCTLKIQVLMRTLFEDVRKLISTSKQSGVVPNTELIIGHSYYLAPSRLSDDDSIIEWAAYSLQNQIIPTLVDYQEQGLLQYDPDILKTNPFNDFISGREPLNTITTQKIKSIIETMCSRSGPSSGTGQNA